MAIVLQMTRLLTHRPTLAEVPGVRLRNYAGPDDIEVWLDVRRRAFARQKVGISGWDAADFHREFLSKPWWCPGSMWLAETDPLLLPAKTVGTVTLARRGDAPHDKPVVHWLCVAPGHRLRGVGRLLMATLESAVWDSGERQVWLETHSAWIEALRLYESLGYEPVGRES
jgi:GNAT superfamily N-acetyltransferase